MKNLKTLAELSAAPYAIILDAHDITSALLLLGLPRQDYTRRAFITGLAVSIGDGVYTEVFATEENRPQDLDAIYYDLLAK